jgi:hypothetical protein
MPDTPPTRSTEYNHGMLVELAAMIRAAWDLASLNTDPAPND